MILATAIASIGSMSASMFVPALPEMARELNTGIGMVQLALTLFLVGNAVGQLAIGGLSDYYGRRRMMFVGLGLWLAGSLGVALSGSIVPLLAARLVQATGAAVGFTLSRGLVLDLYDRTEGAKVMSAVIIVLSAGPIVAPVIGGYIDYLFGWRAIFWYQALSAVVLGLWAWRRFPETSTSRAVDRGLFASMMADYRVLLAQPAFLAFAGTNIMMYGAYFSFAVTGPVLLIQGLGLAPENYGPTLACATVGFLIGTNLSNRLVTRHGLERMVDVSVVLFAVGSIAFVALALSGIVGIAAIIAPMLVIVIGHGMAAPNINVGAVAVVPERAGAAGGLLGFLQVSAGAVATFVVSLAAPDTPVKLGLLLAAYAVGACACWFGLRRFVMRSAT